MINKNYIVEFAHPLLKATEHITDIRAALSYASINLKNRHGIELGHPLITDTNSVTVTISVPDKLADSFNAGNHLKGVSRYLLNSCAFPYRDYLVGTRLLNYSEWHAVESSDVTHECWTPIRIDENGHEWYLVELFTRRV